MSPLARAGRIARADFAADPDAQEWGIHEIEVIEEFFDVRGD